MRLCMRACKDCQRVALLCLLFCGGVSYMLAHAMKSFHVGAGSMQAC